MTYYLLFFLFWFIGLIIFSFTIVSILIILFFGIPYTLKLREQGALVKNDKIIRNYSISLITLSTIFFVTTFLVYRFFGNLMLGYFIGCLFSFIGGIGKFGENISNVKDYLETNERFFKENHEK